MQPMEIERVQLLERRPTTTAHHTMMNNSTSSINNGDPLSISPSRQQQHLPSPHNQRLVLPNGSTPTHENSNYHPTSSSSRRETSCGCNIVFHDLTRAGLLGVTTGASVAVFKLMIESLRAEAYSTTLMQNTIIPSAIIPGLGGLVVGILALCGPFPPGLKGIIQETDRESKAIFFGDECNQQFVPSAFFRKTIAAIFTLGSGCSLGPGKLFIFVFFS